MIDGRFDAVPLTPSNAPDLWPYVRSQLLRVEQRVGAQMLPEEVFATWKSGQAAVYVFRWDGELAGAAACQQNRRDDGRIELWVWGLSFDGVAPKELPRAVNEWLKDGARHIGASSVSMKSTRRGWGRYLESFGWKPTLVQYTLEV